MEAGWGQSARMKPMAKTAKTSAAATAKTMIMTKAMVIMAMAMTAMASANMAKQKEEYATISYQRV
jgi:hypothetical protein